MKLTTKYKELKKEGINTSLVQELKQKLTTISKKTNKYLYGKQIEVNLIEDFLEENNISFSDFMMLLFFRDGAVTDEMAIASIETFTRMKDDFIQDIPFTFHYKDKYKDLDPEKAFTESESTSKVLKIRYVIMIEVDKYWEQKGFMSFAQYMKALFNEFELYPEGWYEEVVKNSKTTFKTPLVKKKEIDFDEKNIYNASFTISKLEKEKIINPFDKFLHKKNLNLSKLIRHHMFKLNLIDYETARVDYSDVKKIESLKYEKSYKFKNIEDIEKQLDKKQRETIVILIPDNQELRELLSGKMGTFVKYILDKEYDIYPKFGVESYNNSFKVFQNKKKLSDLIELLNTTENN